MQTARIIRKLESLSSAIIIVIIVTAIIVIAKEAVKILIAYSE